MSKQSYIIIAIISLVINAASVLNVVYAFFSIVLLVYSIFMINTRDSEKSVKDKKRYGIMNTFAICVLIFLSSGLGFIGIYSLLYVVLNYLSGLKILLIALSAVGLIIYYFLIIRLLIEAIRVVKRKGAKG